MDAKDLKTKIQQAAEIAQAVPENLQEAAFNRALDLLTGASQAPAGVSTGHGAGTVSTPPSVPKHPAPEQDLAELLVERMNATEHPEVRDASNILERALAILHGARASHQIDGMTPSEISRVLTEKFRISTRSGSVSDALGKAAGELVDRVKEGSGYRYRIMEAGERHLKEGGKAPSTGSTQPRVRRKKKSSSDKTEDSKPAEGPGRKEPAKRRTGGKPGPKKIIGELIDNGFFAEPKIIGDIIQHLQDSRGRTYKSTELSPALVRLLRDERLEREKNSDGQYEYVAK